jgi:hypothetical protein
MPCNKVFARVLMLVCTMSVLAFGQGTPVGTPATPAKTLPPPMVYRALFTNTSPVIDGILGDKAWKDAAWTSLFVDIEGDRKPRPRHQTRAKMSWDNDCLYIGAFLQEPHLIGTLHQRDTVIFFDNDFEIFMDPDRDCMAYMEFEMNALNTVWDLLLPKAYRAKGDADNSWNMEGLRTAVHLYGTINDPSDIDSGWSVELAIPWTALRRGGVNGAPLVGDTWKIDFSRVEWKYDVTPAGYKKLAGPEDNWVWSPQWVVDMHRPEFWGELVFERKKGPIPSADPAWPAYVYLSKVWYAQNDYKTAHGRYAVSLAELGLDASGFDPQFSVSNSGYMITASMRSGGKTYKISVDENSGMHRQVR